MLFLKMTGSTKGSRQGAGGRKQIVFGIIPHVFWFQNLLLNEVTPLKCTIRAGSPHQSLRMPILGAKEWLGQ